MNEANKPVEKESYPHCKNQCQLKEHYPGRGRNRNAFLELLASKVILKIWRLPVYAIIEVSHHTHQRNSTISCA